MTVPVPTTRAAQAGRMPGGWSVVNGFTGAGRSAANGFESFSRSAVNGFTLVEMLIALLIFGILAAAGASLLAFGVRAQAIAGRKLDDIAALYRFDGVLAADLAQVVPRTTRDTAGNRRPAFAGGGGAVFLRLVRGGWDNVDAVPRPSVQKVDYVLGDDGTIQRIAYPMLDGAAPLPPAAMLSGIASVRLRYRLRGAWSDAWQGQPGVPLPDAVELTIARRDGTTYREMVAVGTGRAMGAGAGNAG